MRVFIGSSSKGGNDLRTVCELITTANMVPVPWSESGLFVPGASTWEGLVELTGSVEAAAFVFREDDEIVTSEESHAVTRDNVVLECGLFTGVLGRRKCAVFVTGNPRIPSDLHGVTHVRLDDLQGRQSQVEAWRRNLIAATVLPPPFTLNQIGTICHAMTDSGITMNRVYSLMQLLGVGPSCVNDATQKKRPPTA